MPPPPGSRTRTRRQRLARKLSSSGAQAFASLTQLPNKLKTAITTKKSRGRSDRKTEHSPDNGGQNLSLRNLNLTTAAPGDDSGGGPIRPAVVPPLEVKLPSETPALEPSWAAAVATVDRPHIGSNASLFIRAGKPGHTSAAPDFLSAGGKPAQGGDSRLGPAAATSAATVANTPDKSIVHSSAGGPVDMRGQGGTGGGAASPDLAGYSEEELLRARRASPDPPPFKPRPGECPGTPAYPGYEEALEKQARKNERKRAAAVAYRPVFVPPEPDQGPIPPCPPAPRLGPVRGPGTGEKTAAHTHQPEPQEGQQVNDRTFSDQHPRDLWGGGTRLGEVRSIFEDPPTASGPTPAVGLAATDPFPLRSSAPDKRGWASSESAGTVSGQLRAAAAATAAATFPLPMGALKFLPCYSGKVPVNRRSEFPHPSAEPVSPEKVGWTSSESEGEDARLRSDAVMDIAREGEAHPPMNVADKVWDCPEPLVGAGVDCEGGGGGQSEGAHARLNDAEASHQRRSNEVGRAGCNRAAGAEASRLPATCLPDAATSLAADERAKTIGHGSVRAAINLFERSARFQSGGAQVNAAAHPAVAPSPCLPQLPTRGVCVNEDATAFGDTLVAEKTRYHEDAISRVTVWVEAVTMQPRGGATLSEWFRDGSVLVRLVNTVKPGVAKPGERVAKRSVADRKEGSDAPTPTENLSSFFEACLELGVPNTNLFSEYDLEPGREGGLGRVVACLEVLGSTAVVAAPWYLGPTLAPPTPI